MTVHLLASCLDEKDLNGTLLTFKTLRVGFPTAQVHVWGNGLSLKVESLVRKRFEGEYTPIEAIAHDEWIERLINKSSRPFWICDTDVVFYNCVEGWKFNYFAGGYEPAFVEPWSRTHKVDRLHTCLMYINPLDVRSRMASYIRRYHPSNFPFAPEVTMIKQAYIPQGDKPPLFYDTCAGMYHAIGGEHFNNEQLLAYEHLHCGVYASRISRVLPGIVDVHNRVFDNTECAKGLRQQQFEFYKKNAI